MADHMLWERMQPILRGRISAEDYEVWFSPLHGDSQRPGALSLIAPSRVYAEYLRDHHLPLLAEVAAQVHGATVQVTISTAHEAPRRNEGGAHRATLNPRYTFATFVAGPSNQFARAAAQSVAENPGRAYNPLFIYGGSGLGKTHLLHAIGNELLGRAPHSRVRYVPTENFVNELINSIRLQRMAEFRDAHRSVEVLLLDDAHILAGKERTQEEFFHTFNTLHEAGRQIVLTSDTTPANIQGLEERLRTRFIWGLVADIQAPDLETKCAIVREKAHSEGVDLPDDVVLFIARRVRENVRELEGYLNRVIIYLSLTGQPATVETTRTALSPLLPEERHTTPAEVIRFVAHHYGIKVSELRGRNNRRSVAFPRQIAMYLIREILDLSYPEIGKLFAKHHSTVMYSVEQITEQRRSNPSLDTTLTTFVEHFR
jgi:chromosomal replication initiator protein